MSGIGMMAGMIVFWIIIITLAVFLINSIFKQNTQSRDKRSLENQPTAQQILEQRYARGEINQEQFHIMQQDIN